jgi:hypothetical protein
MVTPGPLLRRKKSFFVGTEYEIAWTLNVHQSTLKPRKSPSYLPGIRQWFFSLPVTILIELFRPLDMSSESRNGTYNFFCMARRLLTGQGVLGFTIIFRHTTNGRTVLDEWPAWYRDLYLTTYDTHKRQASLPSVRFEPAIPESEWQQVHTLDLTASRTGHLHHITSVLNATLTNYLAPKSHFFL